MRLTAITFAISLSAASLFALDAQFKADSLWGSLGDIIAFGWQINHAEGADLNFTEIDLEGSGIEVLDRELTPSKGGSYLHFNTAIYDSVGLYSFPSSVVYADVEGITDSLFLRGPDLEIRSVLTVSDTTFRDIKGLHKIRTPINIFYAVLLLAILALAYLIFYLVKRFKKKQVVSIDQKIIVPPEEAHIVALRGLERLRRSKYLRFEQYKEFYSELTHILKEYYENRFLIDALEQTTSELMETMTAMTEFDEDFINETSVLLTKADLIKFAKGRSDELESGEALNQAVDIVKRTQIQNNQGENT